MDKFVKIGKKNYYVLLINDMLLTVNKLSMKSV